MAVSTSFELVICVLTCLCTVIYGTHYPDVIYLDGYCDNTYPVASEVRIILTRKPYLGPGMTCTMNFTPDRGSGLVARFLSYKMKQDYISETGVCTVESIQLYNSAEKSVLATSEDFCGSRVPPGQLDLGNAGTFRYTTTGYSNIVPATIDLLVTEVVSINSSYSNSSCPDGFFNCRNNYCVYNNVICNGYDNCGNSLDESEGCGLSPGEIGGIVIGTVIIIIFLCIAYVFFRRRQRRALYVQQY